MVLLLVVFDVVFDFVLEEVHFAFDFAPLHEVILANPREE
jgi:hypothetical protein